MAVAVYDDEDALREYEFELVWSELGEGEVMCGGGMRD